VVTALVNELHAAPGHVARSAPLAHCHREGLLDRLVELVRAEGLLTGVHLMWPDLIEHGRIDPRGRVVR